MSRAAGAGQRALRRKQLGLAPGSTARGIKGPTNLEDVITRELGTLSTSPFDPQFAPLPQFAAPERPEFKTEREVPFLADLESSIEGIRRRETGTTPGELAGLEGMFEAADPSLRLQKAQEYINQIVGPRNEAAAIAAGFGRGPAALEATTRAGAELALPIVTEAGRQQAIANQFKVALEQARMERGRGKERDVFEAVLNKVAKGVNVAQLNSQERQVLAQFNLSAAGMKSEFDLAGAGLQSEREIARANVGLSTRDRTLALINQLRTMRTSQAGLNARAPVGLTSRRQAPTAKQPETQPVDTAAIERKARFARTAAEAKARDARLAANPLSFSGGLTGGGGAASPTSSFITSTGPMGGQRKTLFGSPILS